MLRPKQKAKLPNVYVWRIISHVLDIDMQKALLFLLTLFTLLLGWLQLYNYRHSEMLTYLFHVISFNVFFFF